MFSRACLQQGDIAPQTVVNPGEALPAYRSKQVEAGYKVALSRITLADYDFQFIYEHSAAAAAKTNPSYRYVSLPDRLDLSTNAQDAFYAQAFVSIPGVAPGPLTMVTIPATPVAWGLTIPKQSRNQENAVEFVSLLLGPAGTAALTTNGPTPMTPALVSATHLLHVPPRLRSMVSGGK